MTSITAGSPLSCYREADVVELAKDYVNVLWIWPPWEKKQDLKKAAEASSNDSPVREWRNIKSRLLKMYMCMLVLTRWSFFFPFLCFFSPLQACHGSGRRRRRKSRGAWYSASGKDDIGALGVSLEKVEEDTLNELDNEDELRMIAAESIGEARSSIEKRFAVSLFEGVQVRAWEEGWEKEL